MGIEEVVLEAFSTVTGEKVHKSPDIPGESRLRTIEDFYMELLLSK